MRHLMNTKQPSDPSLSYTFPPTALPKPYLDFELRVRVYRHQNYGSRFRRKRYPEKKSESCWVVCAGT